MLYWKNKCTLNIQHKKNILTYYDSSLKSIRREHMKIFSNEPFYTIIDNASRYQSAIKSIDLKEK